MTSEATPPLVHIPSRWKAGGAAVLTAALIMWRATAVAGVPAWLVAVLAMAVAGAGLVWRARPGARLRRQLGRDGWLGLRQWWGTASPRAARRLARNRGAPLSAAVDPRPWGRRRAACGGAQVGRVVSGSLLVRGRAVCSPWSRGVLVVGPPGSGKSSWLVGPVLDAPGPAYVSSTKTELVDLTSALRSGRGRVQVFNPTGLGGAASTFGWNPLSGCTGAAIADGRARALVRGGGGGASGQQAEFWSAKAAEIVRCYLLAAALTGQDMGVVMEWALRPDDPTVAGILEEHAVRVPAGWVATMHRNLTAAPNERSGYQAAVVPAVSFVDNPLVAAACRPDRAAAFDVEAFVSATDDGAGNDGAAAGAGTVYVIAGEDRRIAPLVTALTEAVFEAAKRAAATQPGGRLARPLCLFLDEVANTTPVQLDNWAADSRGSNITVCAVVQDLAQLESRWGTTRAQTIFANLPTKVVLPGVADTKDLDALAYLAGQRRVRQTSHSTSHTPGRDARRSRSVQRSVTREPVITGPLIYSLPRWHAYVLGLGPRAIVVRFRPGYRTVAGLLRRLPPTYGWASAPLVTPLARPAPAVGPVRPLRVASTGPGGGHRGG